MSCCSADSVKSLNSEWSTLINPTSFASKGCLLAAIRSGGDCFAAKHSNSVFFIGHNCSMCNRRIAPFSAIKEASIALLATPVVTEQMAQVEQLLLI